MGDLNQVISIGSIITTIITAVVTAILPSVLLHVIKQSGSVFFSDTLIEYALKKKAEKQRGRFAEFVILVFVVLILQLSCWYIISNAVQQFGVDKSILRRIGTIIVGLVMVACICILIYRACKKEKRIKKWIQDVVSLLLLLLSAFGTMAFDYDDSIGIIIVIQGSIAYFVSLAWYFGLNTLGNIDESMVGFNEDGVDYYIYHGISKDMCLVGTSRKLSREVVIYPIEELKKKTVIMSDGGSKDAKRIDGNGMVERLTEIKNIEMANSNKIDDIIRLYQKQTDSST